MRPWTVRCPPAGILADNAGEAARSRKSSGGSRKSICFYASICEGGMPDVLCISDAKSLQKCKQAIQDIVISVYIFWSEFCNSPGNILSRGFFMLQLRFAPQLHSFDACKDVAEYFRIGQDDVILSNRYIYEPFFGGLNLPARLVFQEDFGEGEPTDSMVDAILAALGGTGARRIFAIGGGSVIDIAKVLAVAPEDASVDDLYADMASLEARRELIILPTTCGTGSEVTNISILNRTRLGTKMGLVSESMYAAHAALVPELLSRLPYQVFAASSLDALVHAAESLLSPNATDFTRLLSREAIALILNGYLKMRDEGLQARLPLLKDFLLASTLAGLAFGTAGCAAVHALSYPLGGTFHVPHGESNYALFTQVLKSYRSIRVEGSLAGLLELLSRILGCSPERALDELETLLAVILPLKPLREYGMTEQHVPEFARNVLATQQRLLKNNFTPLSEEEIAAIYRARL